MTEIYLKVKVPGLVQERPRSMQPPTDPAPPQPGSPDLTLPEYTWGPDVPPDPQDLWDQVTITSHHGLFGSQDLVSILAHFLYLGKSFHPPGLSFPV